MKSSLAAISAIFEAGPSMHRFHRRLTISWFVVFLVSCDFAKPVKEDPSAGTSDAVAAADKGKDETAADGTPADKPHKGSQSTNVTDVITVSFKTDVVLASAEASAFGGPSMESLLSGLAGQTDLQLHILSPVTFLPPAKIDAAKFAFIAVPMNRRELIGTLNNFFSGQFNTNYTNLQNESRPAIPFRSDAFLEVVLISTDDAEGAGLMATDYNPKLKASITVNTVTALPGSVSGENCRFQRVSTEYYALAKLTGGQQVDICGSDWSDIGKKIVSKMVSKANSFALSKVPTNPGKIEVLLDGHLMSTGTWKYNAENNTVSIVRNNQIKNGVSVSIKYSSKAE